MNETEKYVLAFQAGSASRDKELDQLRDQVAMLREALAYSWSDSYIDGIKARAMAFEALAATEPK